MESGDGCVMWETLSSMFPHCKVMMTLLKMTGGRRKVKEKEQEGTETDQTHRGAGECEEEGTDRLGEGRPGSQSGKGEDRQRRLGRRKKPDKEDCDEVDTETRPSP